MKAQLGDNKSVSPKSITRETKLDKSDSREDRLAVQRILSDNRYNREQLDVCL